MLSIKIAFDECWSISLKHPQSMLWSHMWNVKWFNITQHVRDDQCQRWKRYFLEIIYLWIYLMALLPSTNHLTIKVSLYLSNRYLANLSIFVAGILLWFTRGWNFQSSLECFMILILVLLMIFCWSPNFPKSASKKKLP